MFLHSGASRQPLAKTGIPSEPVRHFFNGQVLFSENMTSFHKFRLAELHRHVDQGYKYVDRVGWLMLFLGQYRPLWTSLLTLSSSLFQSSFLELNLSTLS